MRGFGKEGREGVEMRRDGKMGDDMGHPGERVSWAGDLVKLARMGCAMARIRERFMSMNGSGRIGANHTGYATYTWAGQK